MLSARCSSSSSSSRPLPPPAAAATITASGTLYRKRSTINTSYLQPRLPRGRRYAPVAASSSAEIVAAWCSAEFARLVALLPEDEADDEDADNAAADLGGLLPLAKAALLVALEDEAAALAEDGGRRTSGGAATWSLSRLDALADAALRHFAAHWAATASEGDDGSGSGGGSGLGAGSSRTLPLLPLTADRLAAWLQDGAAAVQRAIEAAATAAAGAVNSVGSASSAARSSSSSSNGGSASGAAATSSSSSSSSANPPPPLSRADAAALARQYPAAALASVSAVVFEQHGYRACNRWFEAADARLSSVLEAGRGSCVALCLVYAAVAARLGLDLALRVLRDPGGGPGGGAAYYAVAWPANAAAPLAAGGARCVVDVYGGGALLSAAEVCELFGVESEDALLERSPRRVVLAALLGEARRSGSSSTSRMRKGVMRRPRADRGKGRSGQRRAAAAGGRPPRRPAPARSRSRRRNP